MSLIQNELLIAIRALNMHLPCGRVYTTIRKHNTFRVKFYDLGGPRDNFYRIVKELKGWDIFVARFHGGHDRACLTIIATKQ